MRYLKIRTFYFYNLSSDDSYFGHIARKARNNLENGDIEGKGSPRPSPIFRSFPCRRPLLDEGSAFLTLYAYLKSSIRPLPAIHLSLLQRTKRTTLFLYRFLCPTAGYRSHIVGSFRNKPPTLFGEKALFAAALRAIHTGMWRVL